MSTRDIIEIDEDLCNGCGQCILDCAEGAIRIVDGKARVIADHLCDGLGACLSGCPAGALRVIRREADAYDEEAVERHLAAMGKTHHGHGGHGHAHGNHSHHGHGCPSAAPGGPVSSGCGCPSAKAQALPLRPGAHSAGIPAAGAGENAYWPLKLRLMAPEAPFLRGARLLLAADCAALAAPGVQVLKPGRVCLMACPKFEDPETVVERLAAIFRAAEPADVTVVRMEVPCCKALTDLCRAARERAGLDLPTTETVVARTGEVRL